MARFNVETVPCLGGEKYQIRDSADGSLVSRNNSTVWNNYPSCLGWAHKCNAAGHTHPTPEPYRNPRMGG